MLSKRINRASAEQVFIAVRNTDSNTASVGHAVVWNYQMTATGDGYSICFARTTATQLCNPGAFAGIVAIRDIQPGDYGHVQCYGQVDSVYLTGSTAGGLFNGATLGQTAWTGATITNMILRPAGAIGVSTGAVTNLGYLGVCTLMTSGTQTYASADWAMVPFWPGGYVVPVGPASGTFTFTSSATCKAFVKALA